MQDAYKILGENIARASRNRSYASVVTAWERYDEELALWKQMERERG